MSMDEQEKFDYTSYSEEDLIDALAHIDRERYPERVKQLESLLRALRHDFETNIKPNFTDDEKFEYLAQEIENELISKPHTYLYFIICLVISLLLYYVESYVPAFLSMVGGFVIEAIVLKSNDDSYNIISKRDCPVCHGPLDIEQVQGPNRSIWCLHCWRCRKMATIRNGGLS